MRKFLAITAVATLMAATYGTYIYFASTSGSPEEVTVSMIKPEQDINPLGNISDGSFPNCTTLTDVDDISTSKLFTITASSVKESDVYIRKGWVDRTQKQIKRVGKRRRTSNVEIPQYSKFSINKREYVAPIHIISLADGKEIAAVIEPKYISKLESGESVTLPIGKKLNISSKIASHYFRDAKIKAVYYSLNDSWYSENASAIKRNAIIYAAIVLIVLGGLLVYFGGALFNSPTQKDN